jgi:hypothetical protein
VMKQMKWPRPPLLLGFVLGDIFERYMFISIERYGWDWLSRPLVVILFALALLGLLRPLIQDLRAQGGLRGLLANVGRPVWSATLLFPVALAFLLAAMLWQAAGWNSAARIVPMVIGVASLVFVLASLANAVFLGGAANAARGAADLGRWAQSRVAEKIHMDIDAGTDDLPRATVLRRGAVFLGWTLGFMGSTALVGLIPTVPLFVVAYMRLENREPWSLVLPQAVLLTAFFWYVFGELLNLAWPETWLGNAFPALKVIPSL